MRQCFPIATPPQRRSLRSPDGWVTGNPAWESCGRRAEMSEQQAKPRRAAQVWTFVGVLSSLALGGAMLSRTGGEETKPSAERKEKAPTNVRAVLAEKATVPIEQEYRGELVANVAELASQGSGRLMEVRADLGDKFEKDDVLAVIDASETRRQLTEARAQVKAADAARTRSQAELRAAQLDLERAERLLAERVVTEQEATTLRSRVSILTAEVGSVDAQREAVKARVGLYSEQLSQAQLRAPFPGAIAERYLDPGATVQPGTPVLRLVQAGPMKVRFRASEQHLNKLSEGVPLQVTTLATGDQRHLGKVERISAEVSRTDRTIAVEGVLAEADSGLRAGMYAAVSVQLGVLDDATLIPAQAIVEKIDNSRATTEVIWTVIDGVAREREVDILGRHQGRVAIANIAPGTSVVVFGQQTLSEGDRVRVTEQAAP